MIRYLRAAVKGLTSGYRSESKGGGVAMVTGLRAGVVGLT